MSKRIGILTSGGDCPGLNAVIRGAVKACYQLGYDCVGFHKGYEGLYDPVQYVHLTQDSTRGILNQGGTILGSTNKGRFAATVGVQDRKEIDPALMEGVKATIKQLGIDGLICVGGDGSLAVAQQFHEQGIPVVGVPKTIDNDLSATAFTFGFDSAIECATDALDRLHTTAASHERIMVLEVMGRHAGWIALHAGIAGGGDVILIPEVEWNYEHVCHKILHRESQGKKFTLVVVAEGAELPGGDLVGEQRDGQQMKLGGVGRAVAEEIEKRLHRETRLSVLGHLQRGGNPTTFDRVLATQFGAHAVRLVKEGRFGEMICSRPPEMTSVPIMEAVNVLRRVDPHGPCVQAARALGISFGDRPADEIGQDVFDRVEAVTHVDELPSVAPTGETLSETPAPASDEAEELAYESVAETVLDLVADADEAAHGPVAEPTVEPADETPVDPPREEERLPELPETDAAGAFEPEVESGEALLEEPRANEDSESTETERAMAALAETLSVDPLPEPVETPAAPIPEVDLSAAQAMLTERMSTAAELRRDEAAVESSHEDDEPELSVADLVKQKLAEVSQASERSGDETTPPKSGEDPLAEARSALEEALTD